jgi:probable phosphoglycerate mutase
VARLFARERVDVLVSSPMHRARETAQPIAVITGLPVAYDDRLIERMNWDGSLSIHEFLEEWERATQDRSFVPGVGDSSAAAGARFAEVVHELAATPGCNAVLVAHGGVTIDGLRTLVGDRDVARALSQWRAGVPPASITRLRLDGSHVELLSAGDTTHLNI